MDSKCSLLQQPGCSAQEVAELGGYYKVIWFTYYFLILNLLSSWFYIWVTQSLLSLEVWKWSNTASFPYGEYESMCCLLNTQTTSLEQSNVHTHTHTHAHTLKDPCIYTLTGVHPYAHSKLWNCLSKNRRAVILTVPSTIANAIDSEKKKKKTHLETEWVSW